MSDEKELDETEVDFDLKPGKKIIDEDDPELEDALPPIIDPADDDTDSAPSEDVDDEDSLDFERSDDYDPL